MMMVLVVLVMMTLTIRVFALVLMMVMMHISRQTSKLLFDGIATLHSCEKLRTVKNIPRSGYNRCGRILFAQKSYGFGNLFVVCTLCVRKNDAACILYLIIEKLAKVLHVHFALFNVGNRGESTEKNIFCIQVLNSTNDIRQFTYTGRFNKNTVGMIFVKNLLQCFAKVPYQRAADATAVHFGYFNAGILHKTAVNADFTEFVFD